ncbi:MAG: anti-sigma factor [Sneathiella sp.]|uniref:anti-sigma factor n=1 Tax=Sneathiella sp. TaxID=1964365 RepID=UPI000C584662|nr:anti-sigma factor [Sneathiella sp.]MAZ04761.1 anti-sigma factor [Sneathiella sp.]
MTTEDDIKDPDDILAAEYVLGVLPHAEREAFAARLSSESSLQSRVQFWEGHFADLEEEFEPVTPPARVLSELEAEVFGTTGSDLARASGWWGNVGFWRGLSAISLAALVIVAGLYSGIISGPEGPEAIAPPVFVAELSGENGDVELVTLYDARSGIMKVNRVEGEPASGRSFELWLIEGGNDPVSLGLVPTASRGEVTVPEDLRDKFPNAIIAISDEPAGGSPAGQPTGPVLATGKATEI